MAFVNPFRTENKQPSQSNESGLHTGGTPTPLESRADPGESINDPNNTTRNPKNPPKKEGEGDDPLKVFGKLWEDDPIDPKNPPKEEPTTFLPTIDPTKLTEGFNKIDFSRYITPEESAAIKAGGDGAHNAHISVLNKSLRQAMMTMFSASQKMVEAGLSTAQGRFMNKVPSHVKDVLVQGNLTKNNKLMSNPAFSPLIESVRQRYQEKFPKATADQISESVSAYLNEFIKAGSTTEEEEVPNNQKKLRTGSEDADWEDWITPKS
jgi:hypothetical protein